MASPRIRRVRSLPQQIEPHRADGFALLVFGNAGDVVGVADAHFGGCADICPRRCADGQRQDAGCSRRCNPITPHVPHALALLELP